MALLGPERRRPTMFYSSSFSVWCGRWLAGDTSATSSAVVHAVKLRALGVVHESERGKGEEVAGLTEVSRKQTAWSGTSWCGGDGEGDLRRWRIRRGRCRGLGASKRSGLG